MRECRAGASAAEPVAFNRTFAAIGRERLPGRRSRPGSDYSERSDGIRVRDRPEEAKLCRRLTPKLPSTATVANGRNGWKTVVPDLPGLTCPCCKSGHSQRKP